MRCSEKEAIILLKKGYVIGIPTDTIYGFAALEEYEHKIYQKKGRNPKKKLITMLSENVKFNIDRKLKWEMIKNWPGKVTYVFEEHGKLTSYRIPDEKNVTTMLANSGLRIKTTSANKSGDEPCLSREEFYRRFPDVPLLDEVQTSEKTLSPSKIYVYNRGKKIRIR